jgi:acetamidase/formamidase
MTRETPTHTSWDARTAPVVRAAPGDVVAREVPIPPPRRGGGDIDLRHVTRGSTLLLPVLEPGGLVGDAIFTG